MGPSPRVSFSNAGTWARLHGVSYPIVYRKGLMETVMKKCMCKTDANSVNARNCARLHGLSSTIIYRKGLMEMVTKTHAGLHRLSYTVIYTGKV